MKKSPIKQKKIIWGEMEIIELSESDEDEVKIIEEIIPKKEINSKENTNKKKIDKNEIIIIDKDEEEKELEKEEKKKIKIIQIFQKMMIGQKDQLKLQKNQFLKIILDIS